MNCQRLLQWVIGVTSVMLLLVGCGAPEVTPVLEAPAAISTPTPFPLTPIPAPIMLTPKPGQWQGEGVTIKVSTNGTIELIELWVEYSGGFCAIGGKDMVIQADGTFAFSLDDPNYSYQISGKFDSPTTVSITYDLKKCAGNENILEPQTLTAEWRENISDMPTLLPPTVTPTLTVPVGPQLGHWEGERPFVSFEVTANGNIENFVMSAPFVADTCNIKIEKAKIIDNKLSIDVVTADEQAASIGIFAITGNFDSTTVTGTHTITFCGNTISFYPEEKIWSAQWKNPENVVTAEATPMVGDVLLYDDFGSNANGWWVGKSSKENSDKAAEVADGKYRYSVTSKKGTFRWNSLPNFTAKDFLLSVDVTLLEASGGQPGGTAGGFNFRVNENEDYYRLAIYDDNHFKVSLNQGGEWQTPLYPKTANIAINLSPGVVNNIVILVKGSAFTFYANGQELVTVTDTTLSEPGKIGLGVELDEGGQTAVVEFDNLVIKAVP